ncbi:ATP-binding protein [Streptomyces solisilvae]|uniref:ATP-binding protein n=1 Tax=Streptomyces malaysiensis TaxID=92644 RepID=UPI0036969EFD
MVHAVSGSVQERCTDASWARPVAILVTGRRLSFIVRAEREAVPAARSEIAAQLQMWGLPRGGEIVATAVLAVSELVTNVVKHAAHSAPAADVTLALEDGELVLAVHDRHPALPKPSAAVDADQIGGRGLWLIEALAAEAGGSIGFPADADGGGKAVEVRLPLVGTP